MTTQYDPRNTIVVLGPVTLSGGAGFGKDTFIELDQEMDDYTHAIGADGEVVVSKTNDRRAILQFTLLQTSQANAELSALSTAALALGTPSIGPAKVQNGLEIFDSPNCVILRPPPVTMGKEVSERTWKFLFTKLVRVDGGATPL